MVGLGSHGPRPPARVPEPVAGLLARASGGALAGVGHVVGQGVHLQAAVCVAALLAAFLAEQRESG